MPPAVVFHHIGSSLPDSGGTDGCWWNNSVGEVRSPVKRAQILACYLVYGLVIVSCYCDYGDGSYSPNDEPGVGWFEVRMKEELVLLQLLVLDQCRKLP